MTGAFSMILANSAIEISRKGLIRGVLERGRNEYDEALQHFIALAPKEANAIIGVQVSTSTQQFGSTAYMYMTIVGTPIVYHEDKDEA